MTVGVASYHQFTFLARVRMLLVWNGTWRVAIWYRMQPAAQMSAFSVYGSF